jgi:hypothetical protein
MNLRRPDRLALLASRPLDGSLLGGSRPSGGQLVGDITSKQKHRLREIPVVVQ